MKQKHVIKNCGIQQKQYFERNVHMKCIYQNKKRMKINILRKLQEEEQFKPKRSRRKEITKITSQVNELKTEKKIEKNQ